jgi:hypothetical protein
MNGKSVRPLSFDKRRTNGEEDGVARKLVTKARAVKPRMCKRKSPDFIAAQTAPASVTRRWILDLLHEVVAKSMRGETGFNGSWANAALKLLGQEEGMLVELKRMSIDPLDGLTREEMKQLNDYLDRIAARLDFKSAAAPAGGAAQPGQDPA